MKKQLTVVNEKRKCVDCLYCKVSATSSKNCRLCFCSQAKNRQYDLEFYWLNKSICKQFADMSA